MELILSLIRIFTNQVAIIQDNERIHEIIRFQF